MIILNAVVRALAITLGSIAVASLIKNHKDFAEAIKYFTE